MKKVIDLSKDKFEGKIDIMDEDLNKNNVLFVDKIDEIADQKTEITLSLDEIDYISCCFDQQLEINDDIICIAESEENINDIDFYCDYNDAIRSIIDIISEAGEKNDPITISLDFNELDAFISCIESETQSYEMSKLDGEELELAEIEYFEILQKVHDRLSPIYLAKGHMVMPTLKYLNIDDSK